VFSQVVSSFSEIVMRNLRLLWHNFYDYVKKFFSGGWLKISIDILIAILLIIFARPLAIGFASGCFFGGDHPGIAIMFGVTFGILIAWLSAWAIEALVLLCAFFVADLTRYYVDEVKRKLQEEPLV
jgi:hypothetical protein